MLRRHSAIARLRRLSQPGRIDRKWRSSVELTIQRIIGSAWPMRRKDMLAEKVDPVENPTAAAWAKLAEWKAAGIAHRSAVTFLGDGTIVVARYEADHIVYHRFGHWDDRP